MIATAERGTFRDPAGSLVVEGDRAVRTIRAEARDGVLAFLESNFYRSACERGDMVPSTVEDDAAGLRLVHPKIAIPSYPWEWTPGQWLAAAELTLGLGAEALEHGWILKDATPLNVLFRGARPVLVDVLSFERSRLGSAVWLAYGQYVRTFLLPLLAHRMLDWPLAMTLFRRDGYEPLEIYRALGWGQRLSRAALWPVTLPVWLERMQKDDTAAVESVREIAPEAARRVLQGRMADLLRRTRDAAAGERESAWKDYRTTAAHYADRHMEEKTEWVRGVLAECLPERVLDVGANTGAFSALAAESGCEVVGLERDAAAAERMFRMSRTEAPRMQTMHVDLARPTPAVGWENRESASLLSRLEGQFDMVMLLAVVHHFLLADQIPLDEVLGLCARLTRQYLILEWVPPSDPMYRSLMRGRAGMYGGLGETDLMRACAGRFEVVREKVLGNGRKLFLLRTTTTNEMR